MSLARGEVVAIAYGRAYHNAVVVQAGALIGLGTTVIVCPIVHERLPANAPFVVRLMRLNLPRGLGRYDPRAAQVIIDKPQTVARSSVTKVGRRLTDTQLDYIDIGLVVVLHLTELYGLDE
ncbi:MAG: type II toxin-antitoxin system PemK/MazF family toxin [Gammaproteobacteria bacterium]